MKKTVLFFFVFACSILSIQAQWTGGGTLISSSAENNQRTFVSAIPGGGAYTTWVSTSAAPVNTIYLTGTNDNGVVLPGMLTGGNIISQTGDFYAPIVITSEDSMAIVAWYGYPNGMSKSHIYVQKFSQAGVPQWNGGAPIQVSQGSVDNYKYPIIAADKHFGVYLTWIRYDSVITASSPDVYLQHIDSSGNVAAGWNTSGTAIANTTSVREYYPRLALTPDETGIYIMYPEGLVGNTSAKLKLINTSDGSLASGWSSTGLVLTPGPYVYPGIYNDMYLFCDDINNAVCFWVEARSSANGEIYMQRVTTTGTKLMGTNGTCVGANTADGTSYLEIVKNEEGNFLMAYNDYASWYDVDAKKIAPDGTTIWQNLTTTTNAASAYPKPVSDGHKGMFIFYKNTTSNKLYALALDSLGIAYSGWTVPGTDFGNIGNYSGFNPNYDFDAVASNTGEAIVSWNKVSGSYYQVYSCNLLSDGSNCTPPTSINSVYESQDIYVWPNPAENIINIDLTENSTLFLYNTLGELVSSMQATQGNNVINIADFPAGIYILCVNNSKGFGRVKIIKE
jgi:hypothetical protein